MFSKAIPCTGPNSRDTMMQQRRWRRSHTAICFGNAPCAICRQKSLTCAKFIRAKKARDSNSSAKSIFHQERRVGQNHLQLFICYPPFTRELSTHTTMWFWVSLRFCTLWNPSNFFSKYISWQSCVGPAREEWGRSLGQPWPDPHKRCRTLSRNRDCSFQFRIPQDTPVKQFRITQETPVKQITINQYTT